VKYKCLQAACLFLAKEESFQSKVLFIEIVLVQLSETAEGSERSCSRLRRNNHERTELLQLLKKFEEEFGET